ncbi:MAG: hypothetical protein VKL39_06280 [Leptolyngbyaceae bacterium]|nr:hypothetical protein [Leptolyngbyaceae bacterium]
MMGFLRSYIAPFFIVLIFAIAMLAVSARIFLPNDLAAPAPIEEPSTATDAAAMNVSTHDAMMS